MGLINQTSLLVYRATETILDINDDEDNAVTVGVERKMILRSISVITEVILLESPRLAGSRICSSQSITGLATEGPTHIVTTHTDKTDVTTIVEKNIF